MNQMSVSVNRVVTSVVMVVMAAVVSGGISCQSVPGAGAGEDGESADETVPRFFEMRTYTTRPGTLGNLHERFADHTNRLFVKHGMTLVGYWTPVDRGDTLVYILAYPDRAAREASWKAFLDDPEWKRAFKDSHEKAGGAIVTKVESTFLQPTDYSPIR